MMQDMPDLPAFLSRKLNPRLCEPAPAVPVSESPLASVNGAADDVAELVTWGKRKLGGLPKTLDPEAIEMLREMHARAECKRVEGLAALAAWKEANPDHKPTRKRKQHRR